MNLEYFNTYIFTNSINEKLAILRLTCTGRDMKLLFTLTLLAGTLLADLTHLHSFKADFIQIITDEQGKKLSYSGNLTAKEPQFALWVYEKPINKTVYIERGRVTMVEPEIEQVIIRDIRSDINLFSLLSTAKKVKENSYVTELDNTKVIIELQNKEIASLRYKDKFDNDVLVEFSNQKSNIKIDDELFKASYPYEFDVIKE